MGWWDPITERSLKRLLDNTEQIRRTSNMRKLLREEDWRVPETSQTSQPTGGGTSLRRKIRTAFKLSLKHFASESELKNPRDKKPCQFSCGVQISLWPARDRNYLLA